MTAHRIRSSSAAARESGATDPIGPAILARLDVIDQPVQIPSPHTGHRLTQRDRHVVDELARAGEAVAFRRLLLSFTKPTRIRTKHDEAGPSELHAVVVVVFLDGLHLVTDSPPPQTSHRCDARAARSRPTRVAAHSSGSIRMPLATRRLRQHLEPLPAQVAEIDFFGAACGGMGFHHRVVAGQTFQLASRLPPPRLPRGSRRGAERQLPPDAVVPASQVRMGLERSRLHDADSGTSRRLAVGARRIDCPQRATLWFMRVTAGQ